MSYTQKKVIWEPCHRDSDVTESYLFEANNLYLQDVDGSYLVDSTNIDRSYYVDGPEFNEYGDEIIEDAYGDIIRKPPVQVLVRKQPHEDVTTTSNGKTVITKSIFYVDPTIEPNALNIKYMDKLDGETVFQKYVMCARSNKPRIVRYITI